MKHYLLFILLLNAIQALSQVAINNNGSNPEASAMLDVNSTSKGVLIPRMTSDQRKAIVNPAVGLVVFDTERKAIYMFDGQSWKPFAFSSDNSLPPVELKVPNLNANSAFGCSASIYGDYAVVGASFDTVNGVNTGAAYVFHRENGNWKLQSKLFATNGVIGDRFGHAVDIYKDVIVIGAPFKIVSNINRRGRVFVFRRSGNTWTSEAGLIAADGKQNDEFGTSVALYENILLVGAPYRDHNNFDDAGSVYPFVYNNNSWESKGILNSWTPGENDFFGYSVDIWNLTVAVGSPNSLSPDNYDAGAVFTYATNAAGSLWVNGQKLGPNMLQESIDFGTSVVLNDQVLVAGAPFYDGNNKQNCGAYFVFEKQNGSWVSTSDGLVGDQDSEEAGTSLALDGNTILSGSPAWNKNAGRVAHSKDYTSFIQNPDPFKPWKFGTAVAAHNGHYIITSYIGGAVYFGAID
jgi:hypothetical protein